MWGRCERVNPVLERIEANPGDLKLVVFRVMQCGFGQSGSVAERTISRRRRLVGVPGVEGRQGSKRWTGVAGHLRFRIKDSRRRRI